MLRGINRSIIEINDTENKYFERVLIFVRPEFGSLPPERLDREAGRMLGGMSFSPMGLKRTVSARRRAIIKKRRRLAVCLVGFAAILLMIFKYLI